MDNRNSPIGVVIVTYNSAPLIQSCLDALATSVDDTPLEVVVVDNNSTDDVVERARRHSSSPTVIASGVNGGYAAGVNIGLAELTHTSSALVLNPDCRLHPGALRYLVEALSIPGVGISGPRIVASNGSVSWSIFRTPTVPRALGAAIAGDEFAGRHNFFGGLDTRISSYGRDHDVDCLSGAALLLSRRCIDDVGLWDESFFLYSEETDYQLRATRAGHRIRFVSRAISTHDGGDSPESPTLWALLTVNRVKLYAKYHGRLATEAFRVWVLVGEFARILRGRKPSRAAFTALISSSRRRSLYPMMEE